MNNLENIKKFRKNKKLMHKKVYNKIGSKSPHYNKYEKALVEPLIDIIEKLNFYHGFIIDEI